MKAEDYITRYEVAAILRCSLTTDDRMRTRGELKSVKFGRLVRFDRREIEDKFRRDGQ